MITAKHLLPVYGLILAMLSGMATAALPASVDDQDLPTLAPMVERVRAAVVNIATKGSAEIPNHPLLNDPFFRRFFHGFEGMPKRRETQSLGSGVVIDADEGYIVTNHHVIEGADTITITMYDGKRFEAQVIGSDPEADVALLKSDYDGLTDVPFADSDSIRVGDFAVAFGNPFGLGQTVTSGIISALGRTGLGIEGYEDFIQTDASINPGNSGGALVNLKGELIGINTAILSAGGPGNVGIGFAIPINMVSQIVEQLIEYGEVRRGMLGVIMQNLTPELSEAFGLDMHQGVVISQVIKGTAAEKAGLEVGDVVLSINGTPIKNASAMRNAVGLLRIGEEMKITVLRDDKKVTLSAVIQPAQEQKVAGDKLNTKLAGAVIEQSEQDGQTRLVVTEVEPGSPAWNSRLREGDIILSVNRKPVSTVEEFKKYVDDKNGQILLNVQRGRTALFILIR